MRLRTRLSQVSSALSRRQNRSGSRADLAFDCLDPRVLLDATPTPTMPVGAASIFTQLPPLPEGTTQPFLTPSDQTVVLDNLETLNASGNPVPKDVATVDTAPNVVPGSPAASKPVASNQTWSSVYTRNPNEPEFLTNSQAYLLVNASGQPITTGSGTVESYAQYYASLGQTPPAPNAPFFGYDIIVTNTSGNGTMTGYYYTAKDTKPARIGYPYPENASNPVSFGDLSFSTNLTINNSADPGTNFGEPNTPFTSTPSTLFTLTSTARYLDYRTGSGPNGNTPVTVQEMGPTGQFQTVASNGLIPYFDYDLSSATAGTNDFSTPNFGDLGVSVMDLGAPIAGPYVSPTGIDANDLQLENYSDDAATFTWGNATLGNFAVTMSESSPFSQLTFTRGTTTDPLTLLLRNNDIPGLSPLTSTATYDAADNAILITGYSKPNVQEMQVVQDPNVLVKVFYAIYLPTGITIDSSTYQSNIDSTVYSPATPNTPANVPLFGAGANDVLVSIPGQDGTAANPFHFVIAALPNPDEATVAAFRQYAFNYITGSTNTFSFNPTTNQVGLSIGVTTENVDPALTAMGPLLEILPLQYDNLNATTYDPLYLMDSTLPGSYLTLLTDFGNTRLMAPPAVAGSGGTDTATISYTMTYNGSLSILPGGAFESEGSNLSPSVTPAELEQEIQLVESQLTNYNVNALLTNNGQGNTYVWGQELQKLTALIPIADQLGLTSDADQILEMVESEMTQWFNAATTLNSTAGQVLGYSPHDGVPEFFYYDGTWDALIGYNAGFGADTGLNDFMYQFGYWIQAAADVATYDPSFLSASAYGPMVTLLIQDVYNSNRSDTMFPYLRSFDAYAGHSWAAGVSAVGSGQNEESISEAINLESGMIAWGNALIASASGTSDPNYALGVQIRNTGIELQTFETASRDEYYLNANDDTFPPLTLVSYGGNTYAAAGYLQLSTYLADSTSFAGWKEEIYASNQFTMQRGTTTFFVSTDATTGNNPESHYAISILPFSPSALYLGADPSLVEANYNNYITQQNAVYGNPVPGQPRALPIAYPAEMYIYQSLFDSTDALNRWYGIGGYRDDFPASATPAQLATDNYTNYTFQPTLDTPAATYYYMQFFDEYGEVDGGVHALNATQTAVMDKSPSGGSTTYDVTYIIENPQSTPMSAVDFSDGYVVTNVPAHAVYALTVERSSLDGPIVATTSSTYAIPNLGSAPAGPTTGGGTNLFLGYSQPAAPQTAVVEPLTLQPQTNPGTVTITPYTATPSNNFSFLYNYGTPYVTGPQGPFPGASLPQSNIVSFQLQHVTGTYDPSLDTQFQLYFKAPLGVAQMDLLAAVQVSYNYTMPDGTLSSYVESYPRVQLADIGGLVVLTNQALGVIGATPGLGSGVAAATHTVGTGQLDPNLHFDVFQPDGGQNQNLVYPSFAANSANQYNRTAQFSPQSFTMTNGTVTFTIFIGRFNNNGTAQYANPELQFYAGLPGYAGFQSFLSIPFTGVRVGRLPTMVRLTSPAPNAIIDDGLNTVKLSAVVTADGVPINEGEVQFLENGTTSLGFAPVVQGVASLRLIQPLGFGNNTINAVYSDAAGGFDSSVSETAVVEVDKVVVGKTGVTVVQPNGQSRLHVNLVKPGRHKRLNVAGLNLNNGSHPLLIVAPRHGAKPRVRIYDGVTGKPVGSFLAYSRRDRGGVSLAAVDYNGGDDIVTGTGRGDRPLVKVFDVLTGRPLLRIEPFGRRFRNGIKLAVTNSSDDNGFTINAQTTRHGKTFTRVFNGTTGAPIGPTVVANPNTKTN